MEELQQKNEQLVQQLSVATQKLAESEQREAALRTENKKLQMSIQVNSGEQHAHVTRAL